MKAVDSANTTPPAAAMHPVAPMTPATSANTISPMTPATPITSATLHGTIGIALLSFAHAHQRLWVDAFRMDARARIVGLWDADPKRAHALSEALGIPWFSDVETLLSHPGVTAAAICSETDAHLPLVRLCCKHHVPVMCEKPLAPDSSSAMEIKTLVEQSHIPFLQVFPQRLIRGNQIIKELLDSGSLGRITHVRKRHGHGFALEHLEQDMPWITDARRSGGRAYMDEGVHEVDLLRHYFGMPVSVCAKSFPEGNLEAELSTTAVFTFPNDICVVHEAGWNWVAGGSTTEIYAERAVIVESQTDCASSRDPSLFPHLAIYWKDRGAWEVLEQDYDFSRVHYAFPKAFLDMLAKGTPPVATVDDGLLAVRIVEGVYQALREQRTISY